MTDSSSPAAGRGFPFWKGHGTGNDFVLFADPDGTREISPAMTAWICNRHRGIGADGLIRAVRSERLPEGRELLSFAPEAEWFMDYRNADGSVAEMCGNGVRVFVHFLLSIGLAELPEGSTLTVGTRAGAKKVTRIGRDYEIDMGPWRKAFPERASEDGTDAHVSVAGSEPRRGLSIDMGNPHTVVILPANSSLAPLDLAREPVVSPQPRRGTNVEFASLTDESDPDTPRVITMRVYERSVGETQACGTGACATAAAVRILSGFQDDQWTVQMPGGPVLVRFQRERGMGGAVREHVFLRGPARMVANGTIDPEMWDVDDASPTAQDLLEVAR
ncbi:diaminopimelate epimerase [Arthrobacter cupressi]|uniref:Diaminopimelate epimerase n=1 Tax=Arthrobacter cupressi TaxID=1045773 RepID=A0A1G8STI4_9MICC|nr:diaminopimelate epimerase [Arthrobacter cupressi]NYD78406.1 diaminopimelate epimerase [Arthrobacter cupressi]SDJ32484.1 diaminopimelate epimerase [Arthrobacter cupressi]